MCRLFGQISDEPGDARWGLLEAGHSLLKQSNCHAKAAQKDGWGLARWDDRGKKWNVKKSPGAVFKEAARFRRLAGDGKSRLHIAHIRHASNPRKLPHRKLIGPDNTQPFSFEGLAFAHNGTLNIPLQVAERTLGHFAARVRGNNDSEVLFWLFVKAWKEAQAGRDRFLAAFASVNRAIDRVWAGVPKRERRHSAPHSGLNILASDGQRLAAQCRYNRGDGKSLCGQNRPYFEMCYNITDGRALAASEPLDGDAKSWKPIPRDHAWVFRPGAGASLHKL